MIKRIYLYILQYHNCQCRKQQQQQQTSLVNSVSGKRVTRSQSQNVKHTSHNDSIIPRMNFAHVKSKINSRPSTAHNTEQHTAPRSTHRPASTSTSRRGSATSLHTHRSLQQWALKQEKGFTQWLNHLLLNGNGVSSTQNIVK